MGMMTDKYRLETEADTGPLEAAQRKMSAGSKKTADDIDKLGDASRKADAKTRRLAPSVTRLGNSLGKMAKKASVAGSGILKFAGGIGRAIGAVGSFLGVVGGMIAGGIALGAALFGAAGGGEAMAEAMGDTEVQLDKTSDSMGSTAEQAEATTRKIDGVLGAFGKVGAGFLQRQGAMAKTITEQSKGAVAAAGSAAAAMADAEEKTASWGETTSRLGKAWENLRNIFLKTIGKALLPLLDKLAEAFEDPRVIEFVTLLAEDLAGAIEIVVNWLIDEAIPAIIDFLDEVNEAGGPFAWLKLQIEKLRDRAKLAFLVISTIISSFTDKVVEKFNRIRDVASGIWEKIKTAAQSFVTWFETTFPELAQAVEDAWSGIGEAIGAAWDSITAAVGKKIQPLIDIINNLIEKYNKVAAVLGLPLIGKIGGTSPTPPPSTPSGPVPQLRYPSSLTAASVAPTSASPVALAGGAGTSIGQLVIQVQMPPGTSPTDGTALADATLKRMSALGIRLPVTT